MFKLANDTKYRKSSHSLVSTQAMMAKIEDFLHQVAESVDWSETKSQVMKIAVMMNGVPVSLGTSVHVAVKMPINARMSARKDAARHRSQEVCTDLLLAELFHPELCSTGAVTTVLESMPSVPLHVVSHSPS